MSKLLVKWDTTMLIHDEQRSVRCYGTREEDPEGRLVYGFAMQDRETNADLTDYAGSPRRILEMGISMLIATGLAQVVDS